MSPEHPAAPGRCRCNPETSNGGSSTWCERCERPKGFASGPPLASSAAQTRRLLYLLNATYTPEGVQVWLAHAEKQGWPLDEQVRRAESLLGQVAT